MAKYIGTEFINSSNMVVLRIWSYIKQVLQAYSKFSTPEVIEFLVFLKICIACSNLALFRPAFAANSS